MVRFGWILPTIVCLVVTFAMAAPRNHPPQAPASPQIAPYLNPQHLIPIAGGRTINLVCLGQGSPTVVLTAGLGGWSQVWYRIQGPLSHTTRVRAWDPAGLGFSGPSPDPQDATHETEDLEKALKGAQVDGPYVMVAHSAGAFVALRLRSGALKPGTPEFDECTAQPLPDAFSQLSEHFAHLNVDPERLLTQASGITNASSESGREVINPQRTYGNMPLLVLTAGQHPTPPDVPADVRDEAGQFFRPLASGHEAYAALSTRGHTQLVPDSGHFIQFENPAVVLAAIHRVLAEISPPKQSTVH